MRFGRLSLDMWVRLLSWSKKVIWFRVFLLWCGFDKQGLKKSRQKHWRRFNDDCTMWGEHVVFNNLGESPDGGRIFGSPHTVQSLPEIHQRVHLGTAAHFQNPMQGRYHFSGDVSFDSSCKLFEPPSGVSWMSGGNHYAGRRFSLRIFVSLSLQFI